MWLLLAGFDILLLNPLISSLRVPLQFLAFLGSKILFFLFFPGYMLSSLFSLHVLPFWLHLLTFSLCMDVSHSVLFSDFCTGSGVGCSVGCSSSLCTDVSHSVLFLL